MRLIRKWHLALEAAKAVELAGVVEVEVEVEAVGVEVGVAAVLRDKRGGCHLGRQTQVICGLGMLVHVYGSRYGQGVRIRPPQLLTHPPEDDGRTQVRAGVFNPCNRPLAVPLDHSYRALGV